ncbi:MAG: hypothetical protein AAFO79_08690, partial [Pseudomonadota bacterium]
MDERTPGDLDTAQGVVLTPEQEKRRNRRSIAIAVSLVALCVLFFVVTVVRLGANVANRPL